MRTIISDYEYQELLRDRELKRYRLAMIVLLTVSVLLIVQMGVMYQLEGSKEVVFVMIFPFTILLGTLLHNILKVRKLHDEDFEHRAFRTFIDADGHGIKVPVYKIASNGKNQRVDDYMLTFNNNRIDIYRLKKTPVLTREMVKDHVVFHIKSRYQNGDWHYDHRFVIIDNGKKRKFIVVEGMQDAFYKFVKNNDYKYVEKQGREVVKERY